MKTDKLFYHLFPTRAELALQLAGMPAPYPEGCKHRSLEPMVYKLSNPTREEIRSMLQLPDTDLASGLQDRD